MNHHQKGSQKRKGMSVANVSIEWHQNAVCFGMHLYTETGLTCQEKSQATNSGAWSKTAHTHNSLG